ncbi:MAG: AMIN domain-containing protein [Candidatus Sulfotelmatobacter sp.]
MKLSAAAALPLLAAMTLAPQAQSVPSIRRVQVLHTRGQVEIEVEASDRIVPQTNVLTGPDRLVVDFVGAVPSAQLHGQAVNRSEVKNLRVGLFSADPPVTRIVLDLNGPQPYKVFPSGRTVILKVGADAGAQVADSRPSSGPALVNSNYNAMGAHLSVEVPPPPRPALDVSFKNGLLYISAVKANLSEVLFAVHQRTGAEIAIPAGAEQEQVVGEMGPAPAEQVLGQLLNGSKFNFVIVNSPGNPQALEAVILSARPEGPMPQPRPQPRVVVADDDDVDVAPAPKSAAPLSPPPPPAREKTGQSGDHPSNPNEAGATDNTSTPD